MYPNQPRLICRPCPHPAGMRQVQMPAANDFLHPHVFRASVQQDPFLTPALQTSLLFHPRVPAPVKHRAEPRMKPGHLSTLLFSPCNPINGVL